MRIALFALALLPPSVPAQPAPSPQPAEPTSRSQPPAVENHQKPLCKYVNRIPAVQRGLAPRAHALGREPRANLYLGVLRYEGGCEKPVMIRFGIEDLSGGR